MLSQISTVSDPPGKALCFLSPLSPISELPLNGLGSFLYFDLDSLVTNAMTEYKRAMNTWALEALA